MPLPQGSGLGATTTVSFKCNNWKIPTGSLVCFTINISVSMFNP